MSRNVDKALPENSANLSRDLLDENETGCLEVGEWVWFRDQLLPVNHPLLQSLEPEDLASRILSGPALLKHLVSLESGEKIVVS